MNKRSADPARGWLTFSQNVTISHSRVAETMQQKSGLRRKVRRIDSRKDVTASVVEAMDEREHL